MYLLSLECRQNEWMQRRRVCVCVRWMVSATVFNRRPNERKWLRWKWLLFLSIYKLLLLFWLQRIFAVLWLNLDWCVANGKKEINQIDPLQCITSFSHLKLVCIVKTFENIIFSFCLNLIWINSIRHITECDSVGIILMTSQCVENLFFFLSFFPYNNSATQRAVSPPSLRLHLLCTNMNFSIF